MNKKEMHLDVYKNRCELHSQDAKIVFFEGHQSEEALLRYNNIVKTFKNGFYKETMEHLQDVIASGDLSDEQDLLIRSLVDGVTSEVGRALVGLSCLQLAIKSIEPTQCIRLHKGGKSDSRFSWQEGISMRSLDNTYNTPFLREYELLKLNKYGIMMTRSLAENYPYSRLYKAEMRGPVKHWVEIVESVESGYLPPKPALCLLLSLLKNNSEKFTLKANQTINTAKNFKGDFVSIRDTLKIFFTKTTYSARAFEVVIHSFMQAYTQMCLADGVLVPLSQMRSANKKHGNVGDIELKQGNLIVESWDAKYGKSYLRDELEELNDKLEYHQNVALAGFIVDTSVVCSEEILARAEDISIIHECEILLVTFSEWIDRKINKLSKDQLNKLGHLWLVAVAESFGQKQPHLAPIDEPCDAWLDSLLTLLK